MKNNSGILLAIFLATALPVQLHAIIGPVRAAKCFFRPKQYNCKRDEIKQAKTWAKTTTAAVLVAAAAAIGYKGYQMQQSSPAKRAEIGKLLRDNNFITDDMSGAFNNSLIEAVIEARMGFKNQETIISNMKQKWGVLSPDQYEHWENIESEFKDLLLEQSRREKALDAAGKILN